MTERSLLRRGRCSRSRDRSAPAAALRLGVTRQLVSGPAVLFPLRNPAEPLKLPRALTDLDLVLLRSLTTKYTKYTKNTGDEGDRNQILILLFFVYFVVILLSVA